MTKVDIFSGFLGAGKTTLIKKLIKEAYVGEKLVVIENEFGQIGIDSGFLSEAGIQITEMNSGCICCSLVGDFGVALRKVKETYDPDRILIEPSGVGKLSDVIRAVKDAAIEGLELNAFATVIDAGKCRMYMKNFAEFYRNQIEFASAILLSRTQQLSPEKTAEAVDLVREINPHASLVTTPWDELDGKTLLAAIERQDTLEEELEALLREQEEHHHHHHDHDHECDDPDCHCHDHHHHHDHECDDPDCHCHGHHHHDHDHECDDPDCHCHDHHHHHDHDHECDDPDCHCHDHHHHHDHECDDPDCHCHNHHHHHDHECDDPDCHCHDHHHHHDHECDDPDCHCHDHHHEHHHHDHHADEVFGSWGVETSRPITENFLRACLAALADGRYGVVLRAKGILPTAEGEWLHFDYVPEESEIRFGNKDVIGKLCVIGTGLDKDGLAALFCPAE